MGCWDETCGITGLPIMEGEECIMVVPTQDFADNYQNEFQFINCLSIGLGIEKIQTGIYDSYGWLEDYPGIEENDYDNRPDLRSLFFLKEAWDFMLTDKEIDEYVNDRFEFSGQFDNLPKFQRLWQKDKDDIENIKKFVRVYCKCRSLRINVFQGIQYKGMQVHLENFDFQNKLNKLIAKKLESMTDEAYKIMKDW